MASNASSNLRAPLARARGLGSAKHGTEHWWHARLTSVALIPLTIWFVVGVLSHIGASHAEFVAWLSSPFSAVMMILTIAVTFHHAQSGMQVVYEDYLHNEGVKLAAIIGTKFLALLLAGISIFAVLKISFGA